MEDLVTGEVVDLQHNLARRGLGLREQRVEVAPDHGPDHVIDRQVPDRGGPHERAVAHDGHPLAAREDLVQAVRDEQHGSALIAQRQHDIEQPVDLDVRQGRGRLVHDEHLRLQRDRLRDFDELLVGDRQPPGGAVGVERNPEALKNLRGIVVHRPAIDRPAPSQRLAAHEDVLGDREVGKQRGFLVDDRDTRGPGGGGTRQDHRLSTDSQLAAVGLVDAGQDLDQGRLTGPVLAEQGMSLARIQHHRPVHEGFDGAETLGGGLEREQRRQRRAG